MFKTYAKFSTTAFVILLTFIILINLTWKKLCRTVEAKHIFCKKTVSNCQTSNCLRMNFADCCINELEFRICVNCKNIHYKLYKPFEKMSALISTFANVCYFSQ